LISINDILHFWFVETSAEQRFAKSDSFDQMCKQRFGAVYWQAIAGELSNWRYDAQGRPIAQGRLAEIIILDQLARNIFRHRSQAFAADPLALCLAQEMVGLGLVEQLDQVQRNFALMPFMHSESLAVHTSAITVFERLADPDTLKYLHLHRDIIARFGRYPHRNDIMGRTSTAEEKAFLSQPGSSF